MCGHGSLTYQSVHCKHMGKTTGELGYHDFQGTFLNDKFHGLGRQMWPHFTYEGEYKQGRRHGRATLYFYNGEVYNTNWRKGEQMWKEKLVDPDDAFHGDGRPVLYQYLVDVDDEKQHEGK